MRNCDVEYHRILGLRAAAKGVKYLVRDERYRVWWVAVSCGGFVIRNHEALVCILSPKVPRSFQLEGSPGLDLYVVGPPVSLIHRVVISISLRPGRAGCSRIAMLLTGLRGFYDYLHPKCLCSRCRRGAV